MAPVNIKYIVSFSSQDDCHKANNLVTSDGSKCWLSNRKDNSGKTELILQLEEPCQLAYLDIGSIWCATLEVRVGRSDWPQTMEFKPLMPTVMFMSPLDCHLSRSIKSTQMFSKKDFLQETSRQSWDRLHIICRQPHRKDVQFGLSFIHIRNTNPTPIPETLATKTVVSQAVLDTSSIQKHFFGETDKSGDESPLNMVKYRLMKMAGSAENGCDHEQGLSRTAKLVLKASENRPYSLQQTTSPLPRRGLLSEHCAKKNDVPIDVEMKAFFPSLKLSASDIDRVTIADLRHKFEKIKWRKLTKEEKRTFSELCQNFFFDMVVTTQESHNTTRPNSRKESHITTRTTPSKESHDTMRPKPSLALDTPKDHLEADVCSKNMFNREVTESSASKMHTPLQKTKILHLTNARKTNSFENSDLSFRADSSSCSLSTLATPSVCFNKNDKIQLPQSEAPTSSKSSPSKSTSDNKSNTSSHEVTMTPTSSKRSSKIDHNKEMFSCTGKKQSVDVSSNSCLIRDKKGSILKKASSPSQDKPFSDGNKHMLTTDKRKRKTEADMTSIISYNGDNIHQLEDGISKTCCYPTSSVLKMAVEKDGNKCYQNFCSPKRPADEDVSSCGALPCRRPAKLKKLNKASLELFQEFNLEILESDSSTETFSEDNFFTVKNELSQSDSKISGSSMLIGSYLEHSKSGVCSRSDEIKKPSIRNNETKTKSKKGKIYRMNTSRSKNSASPRDHSSSTQSSVFGLSSCPISSEKDLTRKGDDDARLKYKYDHGENFEKNQDLPSHDSKSLKIKQYRSLNNRMNTSAPTFLESPARKENHMVTGFNQTISGFSGKRSRPKVNKRRTKSIPSVLSSDDGSVCGHCYGIYPRDSISAHQAFCVPPQSHSMRTIEPAWADQVDEMLIDDTVDFSECPICLQRFPQDVLLVHASECGI